MKEIKNIMSIDIDVFFNGHTYRDFMKENVSAETAWKIIDLISKEKDSIDIEVDLNTLGKVIGIIKEKCGNAKLRIINEHNEIVDVMEEFKCEYSTMYNFDAHHDINYGEDNSECNLENWVLHSKNKGLIEEYNWIHRTLSDMCYSSPIKFNRNTIEDLDISPLPSMDLVVICISHYFTPINYWNIIPNLLSEAMRSPTAHFLEVTPKTISLERLKGLDDLLIDNTMPDIYRLFKNKDSWVIIERCDNNGVAISMVSFDNGNMFYYKEVVDLMIKEYNYVEFNWVEGIRNEKFIKRLASNYNILISNKGYIKLKGVD